MSIIIRIKEEYASLVPAMPPQEYQSLKQNIKENGQHLPIILNQDGVLLDGHHRYRVCKELQIDPHIDIKRFDNPSTEKQFVIHVNLKRRHLSDAQRAEFGHILKPIYEDIARQNQEKKLPQKGEKGFKSVTVSSDPLIKRVNDVVAKEVGLSASTYHRGETVLEQNPHLWNEKVKSGKMSINKAYNTHKRNQRKQHLLNANSLADPLPENIKLYQGDFVEKAKEQIRDNYIDLIFTDPPYGKEYLRLYKDLAIVASRLLKVGGSLVTNVGHCIIPDVIQYMKDAGLTYWWAIAVKLSGPFDRSYQRGVSIKWKPLLWFVKGNKNNAIDFISDYTESKPPEKAFHEWTQSTVEAEHVISRLTVENQLVLDPMMGSGTTGVVAIKLNRKFIGIELDKWSFEIGKGRINDNRGGKPSLTEDK